MVNLGIVIGLKKEKKWNRISERILYFRSLWNPLRTQTWRLVIIDSNCYKFCQEPAFSSTDTEIDFLVQIVSWIWSGSRHSGILCVASSSIIYSIIEVLLAIFPGQMSLLKFFTFFFFIFKSV